MVNNVIEENNCPAVAEYLQLAFSSVVTVNGVDVVPDANTWFGVGAVIVTTGGVVSTLDATLKLLDVSLGFVLRFGDVSWHLTYLV